MNHVLDLITAILCLLSSNWWMSSAVKMLYASDENDEEKRRSLYKLSMNRNMRAALCASTAALLSALRLVGHIFGLS